MNYVITLLLCVAIIFDLQKLIFNGKGLKINAEKVFQDAMIKINGFLLDLVYTAEEAYGEKTGQFKKAFVIGHILNSAFYNALPEAVRGMVTYDAVGALVDNIVHTVFNRAKANNDALKTRLGR